MKKFSTVVTFLGILLGLFLAYLALEMLLNQREANRSEATASISGSYSGQQMMMGPLLLVPIEKSVKVEEYDEKTGAPKKRIERRRTLRSIIPSSSKVTGVLKSEKRRRGIYDVPVYTMSATSLGEFSDPAFKLQNDENAVWSEAFIWFSITDNRGLRGFPSFKWDGAEIEFGNPRDAFPIHQVQGGIAAPLSLTGPLKAVHRFELNVVLAATTHLSFVPTARTFEVKLHGDWPHPKFDGAFLPTESKVKSDGSGFSAEWTVNSLASNIEAPLLALENSQDAVAWSDVMFGVELFSSIDSYAVVGRALKYPFLFIFSTFGIFYLVEKRRRVPIHPVQYGLTGFALILFFLLFLALSEHVAVPVSYLIAALACVGLVGSYSMSVFKSRAWTLGFSLALSAVFASLFFVLQSEDFALLMGSLLVFGILAALMFLSRKVDWFNTSQNTDASPRADITASEG